jgi:hypothetical protein
MKGIVMSRIALALSLLATALAANAGDRLLATGGAHMVEGAGGGGIVPWALIAGYGTNRQVGGSAFFTRVETGDFDLDAMGIAVGFHDRVELSFARQKFDAGSVIPGLELKTDTFGAKVKVFGDAVYDQDMPWPQVSVGLLHKKNKDMTIPTAIGAKKGSDTDFYVAATKIWLAGLAGRNTVGTVVLRGTKANQFGLLGFGGDKKSGYSVQPEVSAAVLLTDTLALGVEHRWKPDNLSAFKEEDASDVFLAWFPHRNVAVTAAWARLGTIAGKKKQDGAYISLQLTL